MFGMIPFDRRDDNLFDIFDNFQKKFFDSSTASLPAFRTDIRDMGDRFLLEAELPGFNKEDISLELKEGILTIKAEHKESSETTSDKGEYLRRERRYGSFARSFDVNGITSGYQGEGGKTIIPAWASAKFTFRTVPNMDPDKIKVQVEEFIKSLIPPGITMELTYYQGSGGMVAPLEGKFIGAASETLERVYGVKPLFVRDGGSIPIVAKLRTRLNAEATLIGFGLDNDGIHSPNEKFNLDSFFNAVKTSALLCDAFAKAK